MKVSSKFQRYTEHNPLVPVWCLTHNTPGCIQRFFDSSAISPSGRYVAVFQLPFEDRQPQPGERGTVRLIDLATGKNQAVAKSCGWEPQLGANINWGSTDHELFFNDVDTENWHPFSWKLDPKSGERQKMEGTVYHVSPDGRWLVSANLALIRKTQAGYGVVLPKEKSQWNRSLGSQDGIFLTDTISGKARLLASSKDLIDSVTPSVNTDEIGSCEIYCGHCKFNADGTRILVNLRWFPQSKEDVFELFKTDIRRIRFAWLTMSVSGGDIHCALGPDQLAKGSHHANWCPDGEHISLNLRIDDTNMKFVSVRYDGSNLKQLVKGVRGSGHPTVHPNGHILTDTYLAKWDYPQYGDGTVPLRWIDIKTGWERIAVRIRSQQPCDDSVLRVDPHPSWDSTWRYITFNGWWEGSRRVFLADMKPLFVKTHPPVSFWFQRLKRQIQDHLSGVQNLKRKIKKRLCLILKK